MDLFGIYVGIVEKNSDPEKLGRVKVRVPHVYGVMGSAVGAIPMDDLPWAMPLGLPAGGSARSGGMDWLPEPGDQVCVQFLDGEPEKPVWSWMMQTQDQAEGFKLHQYELKAGKVTKPKRGALTRYGHTVEWNEGSIAMSTSKGYQVLLLDADNMDGQILMRTQAGQFFTIDDSSRDAKLFLLDDFYIQLGSELNIMCDNVRLETITGNVEALIADKLDVSTLGDTTLLAQGICELTSVNNMALSSEADLTLGSGTAMLLDYGTTLTFGIGSTEPFVLGTQLSLFLNTLLTWLATHTHTSGSPGSPTSPPQVPPVAAVQPQVAQLVSSTIFGR